MPEEIKKVKFKSDLQLEIEVIPCGKLNELIRKYANLPHRTDFYHVFILAECSPTHIIDFKPIKIQPNSLLFIEKERVHEFDINELYDGWLVVFTDHFFCTSDSENKFLRSSILFNDLTDQANFQLEKSSFQHFVSIVNEMEAELASEAEGLNPIILKNLLHNFMLFAEREKRKNGFIELKKDANLDITLKFREILERDFKQSKNVSEYANKLCVSEKRLGQATSSVMGKTPKEFINDRIVLEAKRLIAYGKQTIKEIGFELGFDEPTNFVKYFKKNTGLTPVEFRNRFV